MSSAYYHTDALILKKTPSGEADFVVRALTKDFGKIDVLAKGVRKIRAKLGAHLDAPNLVRMSFVKPAPTWASGNGGRISRLIDVDGIARHDDWFSDGERLSLVGKMIKTIDFLIHHESPDPKLFSLAAEFFASPPEKNHVEFGQNFLTKLFQHEGYGDEFNLSLLPPDLAESILKIWPVLKS